MVTTPQEQEAKKIKKAVVLVDLDVVETSFEKWAKPGHFSRTLAKGPKTTTWIWNLHADAHDFDLQAKSLEDVSRKIFSAHFGQLAIIFLWLSGMHFHGAYFSNYTAWLVNPLQIKPVRGMKSFKIFSSSARTMGYRNKCSIVGRLS